MNNSQPATVLQPVNISERIHILDILRGFAVFGILVVNIIGFATPTYLPGAISNTNLLWYDALVDSAVLYLADGKFFTIFSFLFGLGFAVQIARAEGKGRSIMSFYPRRLLVLLIIGVLHAVLFWVEDILRLYALLGFALLAFRTRSNRELAAWAGLFITLSYILSLAVPALTAKVPNLALLGSEVYRTGSFWQVVQFQARWGIPIFILEMQVQACSVMALFLLGLLAGRLKVFENLPQQRVLFQSAFWLSLPLGLSLNLLHHQLEAPWQTSLVFIVAALNLSTAYISGLCLLSLTPHGTRWLTPLSQVGRMALTNYVLQSVICSLLFNGYGLGWYEKVGSAGLLGIAIGIYLAQVWFSHWWMSHFLFGPLEWIWRWLTYLQKPPFRRSHA
ncbi:MAG: hypothetical protein DDG60_10780 [Anaerolineae bacterium]|nr:MAG: hypothetical protein DDG60_10780 [Anaerolineae bacterium]